MADEQTRLAVLIEANTKSYERAMTRLEQRTNQAMRRSTAAVSTLDSRIKGLAIGASKALATLGVGVGIAGFGALASSIKGVIEEASGLAKLADRVGMTTDRVQELTYSAGLADIEFSDLEKSLEQFAKRTGEALTGTGNLAKILEANNVPLRDGAGNVRDMNDLLDDYADLMKNATDASSRNYLATEAFGRSGMGMITMLQGGSAALADTAKEARALGGVIDEDLLRNAEQLNDRFTRLTTTIGTGFKTAVLEVASAVAGHADEMSKLAGSAEDLWNNPSWTSYLRFLAGDYAGAVGEALGAPINQPNRAAKGDREPAEALELTITPTVLPAPPESAEAKAASAARDKIQDVIDALRFQEAQLGRTAREQAIYNELQKAGVTINTEAGGAIAALTGKLYDHQVATDANIAALDNLRDASKDALGSMIADLRAGKTAGEALGNALDRITDRLLDGALNALLSGLLGAPGGVGGGLLFGGARAAGGPVAARKAYLVGERGPEMFVPGVSGAIRPNGGGAVSVVNQIRVLEGQGTRANVREREDGGIEIETMLDNAMASNATRRGTQFNRALRTSGADVPLVRR